MAKDQEVHERFIALRSRGLSYAKISEELSVSKPTLIRWSRRYSSEIEELESGEMAAMCERFRIGREQRVERFVKMIDRIEGVLEGRDLSDVQTERLLREYVRLMAAVGKVIDPERLDLTTRVAEDPLALWAEIVRECAEEVKDVATEAVEVGKEIRAGKRVALTVEVDQKVTESLPSGK